MRLTLDTNCVDDEELLAVAAQAGAEVAVFSVTRHEVAGSSIAAHVQSVIVLPEQSVWTDGAWADGVWADRLWTSGPAIDYLAKNGSPRKGDPFEDVLSVVSNGSFPAVPSNAGLILLTYTKKLTTILDGLRSSSRISNKRRKTRIAEIVRFASCLTPM